MADVCPLRRVDLRSEVLQNEIRGLATRAAQRAHEPFIVWDISDSGMRLWVPERAKAGDVVRLTIAKPFLVLLTCEVRWCRAMHDSSGFQIGVRVLDNLSRLEALHRHLVLVDSGLGEEAYESRRA